MVAKPLTRCPECSAKITNRFECRNCGLLFDRYFKAQARKRKEDKAKAEKKARTTQIVSTSLIFIALIVIAVVGWQYYSAEKQPPVAIVPEQRAGKPEKAVEQSPRQETQSVQAETAGQQAGNGINHVFKTIADIQTPWGHGTGFFITEDKLVTSSSTVTYDTTRLDLQMQQYKDNEVLLDDEAVKLAALREQITTVTDKKKKQEYQTALEQREEYLKKKRAENQEQGQELEKIAQEFTTPVIFVTLIDGRKIQVSQVETSSTHDLALLTVPPTGINGVKAADLPINPGELIYSLGKNRISIKGTVTGFDTNSYIITDTPINRNYSGGPLVDKEGTVHAISILSPPDQQGGLAIPIDMVKREFGL